MKADLKRIEATLHQLENISTASYPDPTASRNRTYSFEISSAAQKRNAPEQTVDGGTLFSSRVSVLSAHQGSSKAPKLPKIKSPSHTHHPNSDTSVLSINPAKEMQTDVAATNAQLEQIIQEIQDIYLEGPIVDGWLEFEQGKVSRESPRPGYRLCGVDASGQKWSRPCSASQLPSVSIAIARYQKLRQLLERKRYLERLSASG